MRISRYGVTLRRIEEHDIEIVRKWRNSDRVRENMLYQEHISKEEQQKWFDSISNHEHVYYIIEHEDERIGLINIKNAFIDNKEIESGLFLFDDKYYSTFIPVVASIILLDIGFYVFSAQESYIKVRKENQSVIKYNESLGYYIVEEKDDHFVMAINRKSFERKTEKLRKAIKNLYKVDDLVFYMEPIDYKNGLAEAYLPFIETIPDDIIVEKETRDNYLRILVNI